MIHKIFERLVIVGKKIDIKTFWHPIFFIEAKFLSNLIFICRIMGYVHCILNLGGGALDSAKNHKRQRRKRQSLTAKREKSQTPKFA